jgi:hypothetical protein
MLRSSRAAFALLLLLPPASARAAARDPPSVSCNARLAGRRVIVNATLLGFFDPELLRLVRLGLAGRLEVEVALQRRRFLMLSESLASHRFQALLSHDEKSQEFRIDGRGVGAELQSLTLDRVTLNLRGAPEPGHSVRVSARLEVVTATSLLQLARFFGGRERDKAAEPEEGSSVSRLLVKSLLQDLARSATGTCELEP